MADLSFLQQVDYNAVETAKDFTPLPDGDYMFMVTGSELKDTSTGGKMLNLELTSVGSEQTGKKCFKSFNLVNNNPKAVQIAYEQLKDLCTAVGRDNYPEDTDELLNAVVMARVKIKMGKPYTKDGVEHPAKEQNDITKFWSADSADKPATQPKATEKSAPQGRPKLPWEK